MPVDPYFATSERIMTIAKGNPGALNATLAGWSAYGDAFLERLEYHRITGPMVWVLFKDHCEMNVGKMFDRLDHSYDNPLGAEGENS